MISKRWIILTVILVVVVAVLAACDDDDDNGDNDDPAVDGDTIEDVTDVTVSANDNTFEPQQVEIDAGTTVVWTNDGAVAHTVTADDGAFDSGDMQPGATFSFTFDEPGTYPYYCTYHGGPDGVGMSGTVVVN